MSKRIKIIEHDAHGNVLAEYESQKAAAQRNGVATGAIAYSCKNPGHLVKGLGKYFTAVCEEDEADAVRRANCGACFYSFTSGTGNCFCDYYLITGQRRPCKGSECEIWKTHPKKKKPWQKLNMNRNVKRKKMSKEQADELEADIMGIIMGKEKK